MHRMRRAGEDDALGVELRDALGVGVERQDLAIDPGFAHPPRNQLGHLRAEIEDKDAVGHRVSFMAEFAGAAEPKADRRALIARSTSLAETSRLRGMANDVPRISRSPHAQAG